VHSTLPRYSASHPNELAGSIEKHAPDLNAHELDIMSSPASIDIIVLSGMDASMHCSLAFTPIMHNQPIMFFALIK